MRNSRVKSNSPQKNILIIVIELLFIAVVVFLSYKIYAQNILLEKNFENVRGMHTLSDELKQSSDDLTHFARTYVVTNEKKYKQRYVTTLDIRNGKAARPHSYETIYWDLQKDIREQKHPLEKKSSLQSRIDLFAFSKAEKQLLALAEFRSNDLVNLEIKAFNLMKTANGHNNNQSQAIEMLHSDEYYQAKHNIMNPIDDFINILNNRIYKETYEINHQLSIFIVIISLFAILFLFFNIYLYFYLKKKDLNYLRNQRNTETRFQELIDNTPTWVWEVNTKGEYTYLSHQVKDLLGYEMSEVLGKTPFDFMSETEIKRISPIFTEIVTNRNHIVELENVNIHKEGHEVHMLTSGSPYFDEDGKFMGYRGMDIDISERKKLENELAEYSVSLEKTVEERTAELSYQAYHDSLTGLPNRVLFSDRLSQTIEKAKRSNSKIALLFIDLDHFKEINDSLGHDIGDEILKEVTSRLSETVRDEDTVARLGGDEFTVILENIIHAQDASSIATKILESLAKAMNINDNILYVSSSIGISIYPDDGVSSQNLLKFADSAMYKAKDEGRNNFQYYNSTMTELAFERVVMETSLRAALKNNEFVVHYQPQVNATTETLIGMEALVRWQHPTMGLVSPAKFIPLAESTGLIVALDRYVMRTAMTQIVQWYKDGLKPGVLAMNLAVKQLQQKDFIPMFKELMKETNCKPAWLELEVTEGQIMTHPEEAIVRLQEIKDLGIELAVDDFGTGYSSLAYLKKLPINKLKIDQAFVRDLPDDDEDAGITKAVIALANSLNLKVIAEGVETKEQRDFLVENSCENIQGYFYSKPVPANDLEIVLRDGF